MAHAGDWLNTVPTKALGLHLRPREFITAVKYWLGVQVYEEEGTCPSGDCTLESNKFGDHAVICSFGGERTARHDQLRNALYMTARQAALNPTREELALIPGRGEKPADVLIPTWTNGLATALDVTVASSLTQPRLSASARVQGSTAEQAHNGKLSKHGQPCREAGIHFLPLAVEVLGGWHPEAVVAITKLGKQLARHLGREEAVTVRHLFQRLSTLLVRGNAHLIMNRDPAQPHPEVDGDHDTGDPAQTQAE